MNVKPVVEADILKAVRKLHKESGQERPVLTRTHISREIMENSRNYPSIQSYNLNIRRKQITFICNSWFEQFSSNWRNGAWVVTVEGFS